MPCHIGAGKLRDPQQEAPLLRCSVCRGEIYRGELYHSIEGRSICPECFFDFAFDYFADCLVCCGAPAEKGGYHEDD